MVERRTPYAVPAGRKFARYAIFDPYLRFWLRFVGPHMDLRDWSSYRGRAVESLVRAALEQMVLDPAIGGAVSGGACVGSYWTRDQRAEVDLVGGDAPAPSTISGANPRGYIIHIRVRSRGDDAERSACASGSTPVRLDRQLVRRPSRPGSVYLDSRCSASRRRALAILERRELPKSVAALSVEDQGARDRALPDSVGAVLDIERSVPKRDPRLSDAVAVRDRDRVIAGLGRQLWLRGTKRPCRRHRRRLLQI